MGSRELGTAIQSALQRICVITDDPGSALFVGHDIDGDTRPDGHRIVIATDTLLLSVVLDEGRPLLVRPLSSLTGLDIHEVAMTVRFTAHFGDTSFDFPLGKYPPSEQTLALLKIMVKVLANRDH